MAPVAGKRNGCNTAAVLIVALCVFVFAIYLKVWPPISKAPAIGSASHVKFWVKGAAQSTTVKLGVVNSFEVIPPAAFWLLPRTDSFRQPFSVSTLSLKDAFAESTQWFRPPPLS